MAKKKRRGILLEWQQRKNDETHDLILQALKDHGGRWGRLRFGQICTYAKRSTPVVARHLKIMVNNGEVTRGDPGEWPRYYYLNVNLIRLKKEVEAQRQQFHKDIDAAFAVVENRRILQILGLEDKEPSVAEFQDRDFRAEVLYELQRPKVGDLFKFHEKQDMKKEG